MQSSGTPPWSFKLLSYNTLAPVYAQKFSSWLYADVPEHVIPWQYRLPLLLNELIHWGADVVCLQEVSQFEDLETGLKAAGYLGVFVQRPGRRKDGCATFWKASRFELLDSKSIDFLELGLEENVALIVTLRPKLDPVAASAATATAVGGDDSAAAAGGGVPCGGERSAAPPAPPPSGVDKGPPPAVVVSNTHLLFDPSRGEVKLGQVRTLLATVHTAVTRDPHSVAVLAGDWNLTPRCPLYEFIAKGQLDLMGHSKRRLGGQVKGFGHHSYFAAVAGQAVRRASTVQLWSHLPDFGRLSASASATPLSSSPPTPLRVSSSGARGGGGVSGGGASGGGASGGGASGGGEAAAGQQGQGQQQQGQQLQGQQRERPGGQTLAQALVARELAAREAEAAVAAAGEAAVAAAAEAAPAAQATQATQAAQQAALASLAAAAAASATSAEAAPREVEVTLSLAGDGDDDRSSAGTRWSVRALAAALGQAAAEQAPEPTLLPASGPTAAASAQQLLPSGSAPQLLPRPAAARAGAASSPSSAAASVGAAASLSSTAAAAALPVSAVGGESAPSGSGGAAGGAGDTAAEVRRHGVPPAQAGPPGGSGVTGATAAVPARRGLSGASREVRRSATAHDLMKAPQTSGGGDALLLEHSLDLASSYSHVLGEELLFTSLHSEFIGTCDYIWFTRGGHHDHDHAVAGSADASTSGEGGVCNPRHPGGAAARGEGGGRAAGAATPGSSTGAGETSGSDGSDGASGAARTPAPRVRPPRIWPLAVLAAPHIDLLPNGLPAPEWGSDHLCVMSEFALAW
ncbi:hypothetical protein FOA52_007611 [Chlamydomonas sp. UWO 241]|nr:hypothetical protein FOA52_007611 [Chlamydomonas sp. UWO 241]